MRNLAEYPITDQEIVSTLTRMAEELSKKGLEEQMCGDMGGWILMIAADIIASPTKCNHYQIIDGLVKNNAKLREVAIAAEAAIHDDRSTGGEVIFQMGGHRRIRLADALKALEARDDVVQAVQDGKA